MSLSILKTYEGKIHYRSPSGLKIDFADMVGCLVRKGLGTLGRKWATEGRRLLQDTEVQRDAELHARRKEPSPCEIQREGFIKVVDRGKSYTKWDLTDKGRDVLPVLITLAQIGMKSYPERVFSDKKPRRLDELFQQWYIHESSDPHFPVLARGPEV